MTPQKVTIIIGLFLGLFLLAYLFDKNPQVPPGEPPATATGQNGGATTPPPPQNNASQPFPMNSSSQTTKNFSHQITLTTNKGIIVFETFDADAPKAVGNFITLAEKKYYDGVIFHRVIKGFMIQGGDPYCAPNISADKGRCGTGGPGYKFEDELDSSTEAGRTGYKKGIVAMANAGPDTNGSQFFIMHQDYPLQYNYTIFGRVVEGQDIVDAIAGVPVGVGDRPREAVLIQSIMVENKQ